MTAQLRRARSESLGYFTQIMYLHDGETHRIDARDAQHVEFENAAPVRSFPSWRGKRNYSGFYWTATNRRHVGFESLTERTALMLLDRDPHIIGISSQPMWICWPKDGGADSHAPDFFVRYDNGDGAVIDVRPEHLIDDHSADVFERTNDLCKQMGFQYRLIPAMDPMLVKNLLFLARYRADEYTATTDQLRALRRFSAQPISLQEIVSRLGSSDRAAGLAAAYSLIWHGAIDIDLSRPVSLATLCQVGHAGTTS
ncbi:TnsA-like heteromeric transposase endonuclease subunit [Agromyces subbeticus]|uniref:TnsA-like heteromeric transposase endonuclease subunit n=1 Tax=Agromyces subbeticus TaxID=293890 RepID=UPI0003B5E475|nr:TnsA-like heteromeric transposase endonuclease subunit [Agromyces subbeticus]